MVSDSAPIVGVVRTEEALVGFLSGVTSDMFFHWINIVATVVTDLTYKPYIHSLHMLIEASLRPYGIIAQQAYLGDRCVAIVTDCFSV